MNYVLIYFLLLPAKWLMRIFYRPAGRNLVIQTAKIGDFVNITPMLRALGQSDLLMSKAAAPLAQHDDTLAQLFFIEDARRSLLAKLRLAFALMNRYDHVYLVQPNSLNLFFAALCNAPDKQFLLTYVRKPYHTVFYQAATGIVEHGREDLTLNSYLKLINRRYTYADFPKHATSPLLKPENPPATLTALRKGIKIGISISAGNRAKTIPAAIWLQIMEALADLSCTWYIFGPPSEQPYLDELLKLSGDRDDIVSLIGQLKLEEVPWAISQMDAYIASDSGNVYIADAQNVPVVVIYGPCSIEEQRPVNQTLLIGPDNIAPSSYIFSAPYRFDHPAEVMFMLDDKKINKIHEFINQIRIQKAK